MAHREVENAERLTLTAAGGGDAERKATVTNDQLDEMLVNDLNTVGYTRDYFVQNQTASRFR